MTELIGKDLGAFGHASVKIEGGKLFAGVEIGAEHVIKAVFEKAKGAVDLPGGIDDALLSGLEAYLIEQLKKQG